MLVTVPPNIYSGFGSEEALPVIVAHCASHQHDSNEISRLDPVDCDIPYIWDEPK